MSKALKTREFAMLWVGWNQFQEEQVSMIDIMDKCWSTNKYKKDRSIVFVHQHGDGAGSLRSTTANSTTSSPQNITLLLGFFCDNSISFTLYNVGKLLSKNQLHGTSGLRVCLRCGKNFGYTQRRLKYFSK